MNILGLVASLFLLFVGTMANLEVLTASDKQAFLDAHNQARQDECAGLDNLKWNDYMFTLSGSLAQGCEFKRSSNQNWGENIMATPGSARNMSNAEIARWAIKTWVSEKENNTDGTFSCMSSSCGNYTQVTWGSTKLLGCAISHCNTRNLHTFVLCAYFPRGNVDGQKPY